MRLRAAIRVLHLLAVRQMDPTGRGYDELYESIRAAAPWQEYLWRSGMTLRVNLRLRDCTGWNHTNAAQQCIQNAVADTVREHGCAACIAPPAPYPLLGCSGCASERHHRARCTPLLHLLCFCAPTLCSLRGALSPTTAPGANLLPLAMHAAQSCGAR
jgi:hypothetical protein